MSTRKPGKPKATADEPFQKKLLTAWKKIGAKALQSHHASLHDVWDQPGCWLALEAALDQELLSLEAVWYLGQTAIDALPGRFAPGLLRVVPPDQTDLWWLHSVLGLVVLRQTAEAPETMLPWLDDPRLGGVVEIAALVSGKLPHGSGSERLQRSIETAWDLGQTHPAVTAWVDGVALRPARDDVAALRHFGEALLGRERLRETLARAHRARLARPIETVGRAYPLDVQRPLFTLAAETLTPEEVAGFHPVLEDLSVITAAWSLDDLVRAAQAAMSNGRPESFMIALSMATLAIERDPSVAPRVEAALDLSDLSNQATPDPGRMVEALLRTPAAWRRTFAAERLLELRQTPTTFAGPVGLVLLASVDPEEAERRAHKHRRSLDGTRLNGTRPELLLPLVSQAFSSTREVLGLAVLNGYARAIDRAPLSADDLVVFDGSYRDSWIASYLVALPPERARAVIERMIAEGRRKQLRAALKGLYGAEPLREIEASIGSA